jgi:hypothetical protein
MKAQFLQLIGNPVFWALIFSYWVFNALVGALWTPDANDGKSYRFIYQFLHLLAGNIKSAFAQYIPGGDNAQKSKSASAGFVRPQVCLLLSLVTIVALLFGAWSCSSWERQTFQVLSANTRVVDCSVAAYNHDAAATEQYCQRSDLTIAQTSANRVLIDSGRQAQITAVCSYAMYWKLAHPEDPLALPLPPACTDTPADLQATPGAIAAAKQKTMLSVNLMLPIVSQLKTLIAAVK